jgi:hypothetical protein
LSITTLALDDRENRRAAATRGENTETSGVERVAPSVILTPEWGANKATKRGLEAHLGSGRVAGWRGSVTRGDRATLGRAGHNLLHQLAHQVALLGEELVDDAHRLLVKRLAVEGAGDTVGAAQDLLGLASRGQPNEGLDELVLTLADGRDDLPAALVKCPLSSLPPP